MYFPEDMNFQYFFFDTYIGYFLQALPIALIVGAIYGIIRFRKDNETPVSRKVFSCAFVCYVTGLVSRMSKGANLAPQEIRIDFAVLPVTTCQ